jgi:hypothetical protein
MKTTVTKLKQYFLPIIFTIGGVIDQSTDLFIQLFTELGLSNKYVTLFRIFVITYGAFKLYLSKPETKKQNA